MDFFKPPVFKGRPQMERDTRIVEETGSKIKQAAGEAVDSAQRFAENAGEALGSTGERLSQSLRGSGKIGEAAEAVSRGVKHTAEYLQEEGMRGIVEDLEVLIRRYPLQTLALGVGCGYLLSRLRSD
jgi:hypothetical protein